MLSCALRRRTWQKINPELYCTGTVPGADMLVVHTHSLFNLQAIYRSKESLPTAHLDLRIAMESQPPLAALALALTAQDWTCLGMGSDPNVAATKDFDVTVERITALLLARIVAVAAPPLDGCVDLSTTSICRAAIVSGQPWPKPICDGIISQLRAYVRRILCCYNDTPYHNWEHAYHVMISCNKLLDLVLNLEIHGKRRPPTYGLRNDPMLHLVLLFSALIHDVEHTGIPNRQLALEDDPLAILYNDQSIAENRSLYIGFSELLKDEFKLLRNAMFPTKDEYLRFRKHVVNLILTTDIASPERTQIGKSKWKEAFGDPFETIERKVKREIKRRSSVASIQEATRQSRRASRCSVFSEITTDGDSGFNENFAESSSESTSVTPDSSVDGGDDPDDGIIFSGSTLSAAMPQNKSATITSELRAQLGYGSPSVSRPSLPHGESLGNGNGNGNGGGLGYNVPSATLVRSTSDRFSTRLPERELLGYDSMFKFGPSPGRRVQGRVNYDGRRTSLNSVPDLGSDEKIESNAQVKFSRRFSASSMATSNSRRYKYRLGILRSVDLSGEAIETYSRSSSVAPSAKGSAGRGSIAHSVTIPSSEAEIEREEVDELKTTVVLEQMMAAADVAHNLQGWDHMVKWSTRLFMELKKAYMSNRGTDPKHRWFENQIGFLESYLLPLARRLEDTGVFGDVIGAAFARIVESNRDRWLTDGLVVTSGVILEGAKKFPVNGDVLFEDYGYGESFEKRDSFAQSTTSVGE